MISQHTDLHMKTGAGEAIRTPDPNLGNKPKRGFLAFPRIACLFPCPCKISFFVTIALPRLSQRLPRFPFLWYPCGTQI